MKIQNKGLVFLGGTLLGVAITLCVGAVSKEVPTTPASAAVNDVAQKKNLARLQVIAYPNGGTGFYDSESGTIYVYDSDLRNCYMTRRMTTLGQPMVAP